MTQIIEHSAPQATLPPATQSVRTRTVKQPVGEAARGIVFLHALAFVLGFAAVFTLLGSAAGLLGHNLNRYLPAIQQAGAILLFLFALTILGFFRWLVARIHAGTDTTTNPIAAALVNSLEFFNTLLYTEKRVASMHRVNRSWGFLSSALLGVSFSAGWIPCIGPILASILFMANRSATVGQGAMLLAVYSLGLGIPFLITGAAFSRATGILRRLNRYLGIVSILSGVFLLIMAYLLWTDQLAMLAVQFNFLNEWVFVLEEALIDFTGTDGSISGMSLVAGAPLALIAGVISFLSPCVLPLVPAYIGYLSSTAIGNTGGAIGDQI